MDTVLSADGTPIAFDRYGSGPAVILVGGGSLVHPTGFRQSPYADIKPAGEGTGRGAPRKLWHSSPGSAGG